MLPKKPGANECGLHWTISLMSYIIKLIQILMNSMHSTIRLKIKQEQCVFVKDARTRNVTFMLRMILEMQMDVYLYFINYTKAFDKVQHKDLFKLLWKLDLFGNDIRIGMFMRSIKNSIP